MAALFILLSSTRMSGIWFSLALDWFRGSRLVLVVDNGGGR
jgi:hypothetical protein